MLRRPRPRPRGLATSRSIRPRSARAPLGDQTRSAPGATNYLSLILRNKCCVGRSWFAGRSGAQRNEESANREGVASGGATPF